MKQLLAIFMLLLTFASQAQDKKYPQQWSAAEVKKANTAAGVQQLSQVEQEVIYLTNLARLNGPKFFNTYIKDYLKGKTSSYISSLRQDLAQVQNYPMLMPDLGLIQAAQYHAQDMGSKGMTGHNSSDGTDCFARIRRYYNWQGGAAENCSYGFGDALGIVVQLLVDDGVPSLGHRKNMLNRDYIAVGVGMRQHKQWKYNCTMDLGAKVQKPANGNVSDNNDRTDNDRTDDGGRVTPNPNNRRTGPRVPDVNGEGWHKSQKQPYRFMLDEKQGIIYYYYPEEQYLLYYRVASEEFFYYDTDSKQWRLQNNQ